MGLPGPPQEDLIAWAGDKLKNARDTVIDLGYEVQSLRIALGHWDRGTTRLSTQERESQFTTLNLLCASHQIDFCGIGVASEPGDIDQLANILTMPSRLSGSAQIG